MITEEKWGLRREEKRSTRSKNPQLTILLTTMCISLGSLPPKLPLSHSDTHSRKKIKHDKHGRESWQESQGGQYQKLPVFLREKGMYSIICTGMASNLNRLLFEINICNHQRPLTEFGWGGGRSASERPGPKLAFYILPLGAEVRVLDKAHFSSLYEAVEWIWGLLTASKGFSFAGFQSHI